MRSSSRQRGLALTGLVATLAVGTVGLASWGKRKQSNDATPLPTGKIISPIGDHAEVGSFPANLLLSPDGKYLIVTNTGFRQFLSVLSGKDGHLVSQLPFNDPPDGKKDKPSLYVGLAFAPTKADAPATLYVSRGPEDKVALYSLDADGKLTDTGRALDNPSDLPEAAKDVRPNFIAGLALSSDGSRCYVANNMTSGYTGQKGSVSILDTLNNRVLGKVVTPGFPFAVAAQTTGPNADKRVYVTSERDGLVSVLDVSNPTKPKLLRNLTTGDHPMALLLDRAQKRLFVANAGSDTVSVVDTDTDKISSTLLLRPEEARGLPGATPTGLALSPDEKQLYVSLADMNAVAVVSIDAKGGSLAGYVPAGWYPTAVTASADGTHLFVANAKGNQPRNANGKDAGPNGVWGQYIQNIIEGTVTTFPLPDADTLKQTTLQVIANNGLRNLPAQEADINKNVGLPSGIKHVIYIVKENRTYDQVLGDVAEGNGDPSLVLFGKDVTPNQHALAQRFVLLDNFYVCAEVSADGWDWSTSGMLSEYTARNAPFNYSGRGRSYDFEGETNGTPADVVGLPDVARAPSGYLWDNCAKHGISFRNYGFYVSFGEGKKPDGSPLGTENTPTKKVLAKSTDTDFLRFAMEYPDSDAARQHSVTSPQQRKAYGKFNSPNRFQEWKREFDAYCKKGDLPQFLMVRFPNDHTTGTRPGLYSPRAMVADNDYAVGQLVEAVSKSRYWKETAIFVIEDDAQSGVDHVDAHRSPCYVISPFVKRSTVDHHFYNTDSVLRTMEALLGMPPMCQYDAVAPVFSFFSSTPDNAEPFDPVLPAKEIVADINTKTAYRAKDSMKLDFSKEDRVPEVVLNDIIWHSVKGANTPEPPARHSLRLSASRPHDDDD